MKDMVSSPAPQASPSSLSGQDGERIQVTSISDRIRGWSLRCEVSLLALSAEPEDALRETLFADLEQGLDHMEHLSRALFSGKQHPYFDTESLVWAQELVSELGVDQVDFFAHHKRMSELAKKVRGGKELLPEEIGATVRASVEHFRPATFAIGEHLQAAWREKAKNELEARQDQRDRALKAAKQIDGITRTVRLISLNAAVEASRAGDAGRGFTVIAQEIKALSERAEQAGGELQDAISGMLKSPED